MFTGGIHEERGQIHIKNTPKFDYEEYLIRFASGTGWDRMGAGFWFSNNWLVMVF